MYFRFPYLCIYSYIYFVITAVSTFIRLSCRFVEIVTTVTREIVDLTILIIILNFTKDCPYNIHLSPCIHQNIENHVWHFF